MKYNRFINNERGITLIALVITIIVLLILAGVAISMLSGENGILRKAAEAKTKTENESFIEQLKIAAMAAITNKDAKIDETVLRNELSKIGIKDDDIISDRENGSIVRKEENSYDIKSNGSITELKGLGKQDLELEKGFIASNSKYKCSNGFITGIEVGSKVDQLQSALPDGYTVKAIDETDNFTATDTGKEDGNPIVTTGLAIQKDNKTVARTVIFGDVRCDGSINMSDVTDVSNYLDGSLKLNDDFWLFVAMDVNNDKKINCEDVNLITDAFRGYKVIEQNRYVVNPKEILSETDSYLKQKYIEETKKKLENTSYTGELKKSGNYNIKGITQGTTVQNMLDILPTNTEIQRNGQALNGTDEIQNLDGVVYSYDSRKIDIGWLYLN